MSNGLHSISFFYAAVAVKRQYNLYFTKLIYSDILIPNFILNIVFLEKGGVTIWIKTHQAETESPDLMNQNQILYNDGVTILVTLFHRCN